MTTQRWRTVFLFGLGFSMMGACAPALVESPRSDRFDFWDFPKIEAYLKTARVVEIGKDLESGRTLPWRIVLDDGKTKATARFKYVNRTRPTGTADSYKYELAGYALSRLLDLEIVPPTVEREVSGTIGAVQWFIEGCMSERDRRRIKLEPPDLEAFLKRLDEIMIFELLANDECQDMDDILIHKETWKVCRVDFSEAFAPTPALAEDCSIERCSRHLFDRLETTGRTVLAARLGSYLNDDELDALWVRRSLIISRLRTLIKEKGERAVIY